VALYLGLYALGFMASSLPSLAGALPVFIYLCYMSLFVLAVYYASGTIGFFASLWFTYSIFKAVKAD
jgi:transmembrane 9 superfamily protein 2/4